MKHLFYHLVVSIFDIHTFYSLHDYVSFVNIIHMPKMFQTRVPIFNQFIYKKSDYIKFKSVSFKKNPVNFGFEKVQINQIL